METRETTISIQGENYEIDSPEYRKKLEEVHKISYDSSNAPTDSLAASMDLKEANLDLNNMNEMLARG